MMFLQSVEDRLRPKGLSSETPVLSLSKSGWQMSFRMRDVNNDGLFYAHPVPWIIIGASSIELMENVNRWIENYEPPKKREPIKDEVSPAEWAEVFQTYDAALKKGMEQTKEASLRVKIIKMGPTYGEMNAKYNNNPRNHAKGKR